jgi:hypothetical protein
MAGEVARAFSVDVAIGEDQRHLVVPHGSRNPSSSASRIRYIPANPVTTFKAVIAMAWSWYHSAVAC